MKSFQFEILTSTKSENNLKQDKLFISNIPCSVRNSMERFMTKFPKWHYVKSYNQPRRPGDEFVKRWNMLSSKVDIKIGLGVMADGRWTVSNIWHNSNKLYLAVMSFLDNITRVCILSICFWKLFKGKELKKNSNTKVYCTNKVFPDIEISMNYIVKIFSLRQTKDVSDKFGASFN